MSLRARTAIFSVTAVLAAVSAGPALAAEDASPPLPSAVVLQESQENENLVEVALGTVGVVAIAGVVVGIGYLYRRQTGVAGHYEDGFTPRDPRDHATH